ncbi:MAG: hypothetical protein J6P09_04510 [Methanobrevibacter sp.]|nr:hypothetical protein [Methanobrevibacter sp.]
MKEKFCEKYFNNTVKPKHLREFEAKTPNGNLIKGYISRKPNRYLGSMIITHITEKNGKSYDTEQFVQSFPKIHYWDKRHKLKEDEGQIIYHCQEKLDGTCLIIYSLNNEQGNSIEIIPKSRSQAVADQRILDMYKLIDKKAIEEFFSNPIHFNDTLMFELYGILNRHEIAHMDTYIDIVLIGAFVDETFLDHFSILINSDLDNFKMPDTIFSIEKFPDENTFSVKWNEDNYKLKNYKTISEKTFPTLFDAIQEVKALMEKINQKYFEHNGRRVIEGIVINGEHFFNGQMYLKVKPKDIEAEARQLDSVPRRFVLKEVQKYFDEFGSNVRALYENDDTHYIKYVKHQLKEEFSYEQIEDPRTLRRIKNTFMDVWDSQIPPKSIQNICEELIRENPDSTVPELMKIFARTYPSKKRQSRYAFNIFSKIMSR